MSDAQAWLAKLEFKRLQTYLFATPKLKSMIGANALVGEVLRGRLVNGDFVPSRGGQNLPVLAVRCGAVLPLAEDDLGPPSIADRDPLTGERDRDDPWGAYRHGILSRDGGHLHAVFLRKEDAERFIREARELVGSALPGLMLAARLYPLQRKSGQWRQDDESNREEATAQEFADLPVFQVCQITGQGPASQEEARVEDGQRVWRYVSAQVQRKEQKARDFDAGQSDDVLGLLRPALVERLELPPDRQHDAFPNEFEDVARESGYLAVIAADGNRIGSRSTAWRNKAPDDDFFRREAWAERFFHSMRVAVRKAVLHALGVTFGCAAERMRRGELKYLPFRLMMLGGDDLLLVCDARYAMWFAVSYAEELENHPLIDDGGPIHIGMGVAVVKKKFPFHRAHALAEELADSAKRYYRSLPAGQRGSTVDWLAVSEAWHEEVAEVRRRDYRRSYSLGANSAQTKTLILSRKPYRILGPAGSLEALRRGVLKAARRLARGQLIALAQEAEKGRRQADWALRLLRTERSQLLDTVLDPGSKRPTIWHEHANQVYSTSLLDFLELFELERQSAGASPAVTPAEGS
jgi:hypothetical protein